MRNQQLPVMWYANLFFPDIFLGVLGIYQLEEANYKIQELNREQESLVEIFSEERQRRDMEEENLRKKLKVKYFFQSTKTFALPIIFTTATHTPPKFILVC